MERFKKLAGIITEVEVKTNNASDLQFILRDLGNAYGEGIADDQITDEFKNYTVGQIKDDWIRLKNAVNEDATSAPAPIAATANTPSDVKNLNKAQATATSVTNRAKAINSIQEFPGAFESWFKTLGFQPGKVSKSAMRAEIEKVLTKLGYK